MPLRSERVEPTIFPQYSLSKSLKSSNHSIIAECKKASPSAGTIIFDYNPVLIAKKYEKNGAKAISVLTDSNFFQGSIEHLKNVSGAVKIPVLRKDFIIDERQIWEACMNGASAILLIVRILSPSQLKEFIQIALEYKMETLVEIHNQEEAKIAIEANAGIIGINTRDLDTFQIYPELIEQVSKYIPENIVKVGESGIKDKSDFQNMMKNVDAALIGTYFMKSKDIESAFKDLL